MKFYIPFILLVTISQLCFGQQLLTVSQVYDFEIGDEFHYKNGSHANTPVTRNADRIKIVDKFYSNNNDSLTYIRFHNKYHTTINASNNLDYHFMDFTDTLVLTNLQDPIFLTATVIDTNFSYDTLTYNGTQDYCGVLINETEKWTPQPQLDPLQYIHKVGEGLGLVLNDASMIDGGNDYGSFKVLYYYKKGNTECGIEDKTAVSIAEQTSAKTIIYPSVTENRINIKSSLPFNNIKIVSLNGKEVLNFKKKEETIAIGSLPNGVYFVLLLNNNTKVYAQKIIKQ